MCSRCAANTFLRAHALRTSVYAVSNRNGANTVADTTNATNTPILGSPIGFVYSATTPRKKPTKWLPESPRKIRAGLIFHIMNPATAAAKAASPTTVPPPAPTNAERNRTLRIAVPPAIPSIPSMKLYALTTATTQTTPKSSTRGHKAPTATRIGGGIRNSRAKATAACPTAFIQNRKSNTSSRTPTSPANVAATSTGKLPSIRGAAAQTPAMTAKPPSLGVGISCELRAFGTSKRSRPIANRTKTGTKASATKKATPTAPATALSTALPNHPELAQPIDLEGYALREGAGRIAQLFARLLVGVGLVLAQAQDLLRLHRQRHSQSLRYKESPTYRLRGDVDYARLFVQGTRRRV